MKSISFGIAVSAVSLSASIMSVMPVISVIFGRRGIFGFTRIDSVSTSVPPVIFTGADFNHAVFQRVQPGGFKVQHDDGIINRAVVFIGDDLRFRR